MCGRYACAIQDLGRWGAVFKVWLEGIENRYNIAPTAMVPVFTVEGWREMRWGLVPAWSKEPKSKYATFNARAESITEKPLFRDAWQGARRCLIPVTGYYEWKVVDTNKEAFFVTSKLNEPLVLAGLWERWSKDELELYSCTIITTVALGEMSELHQRMPVSFEPDQGRSWLWGSMSEAQDLLQKSSLDKIYFYRVSADVGNPRHQGKSLIKPLEG